MQLTGILDLVSTQPQYQAVLNALRGAVHAPDLGLIRAARPFVLAALARDWPAPVIYITARVDRAYNVSEQIPAWLGNDTPVLRLAEPTALFYERVPWSESAIRSRIETLAALTPPDDFDASRHFPIVVTSARALMQRTMPVNQFRKGSTVIKPGQRQTIDRLLNAWLKLGYEPVSVVTQPGTFSRRGGILDVFPVAAYKPTRIEFFDDEIESLRDFEPTTQRSASAVSRLIVTPAREALPETAPSAAAHLEPWFATLPPVEVDVTSALPDAESLAAGTAFPMIEHYLPYLYPNPVSLLDYAPDNALIVVEDWAELRDTIGEIEGAAVQSRKEKLASGMLPPDQPLPYLTWDTLVEEMEHRSSLHLGYADYREGTPDEESVSLKSLFAPEQRFGGQLKAMLGRLREWRKEGDRSLVVTGQAGRMAELWSEQDSYAKTVRDVMGIPTEKQILFVEGMLQEGWRLHTGDTNVHMLTDAEIFGWSRPEPRRRKTTRAVRVPETMFSDVEDGDYVVHVEYGVGRFAGMRRRTLDGMEREYLMVEYAGTDMLFVPIHQADRLTKYIGVDDEPPQMNRLGNPDWGKIKGKARKAVEEEARELLELYAARANIVRTPFNPDAPWQHELEASFPYVETDDQLKAVRAVKADMERGFPMDRLICGDVGYGKTEVALRAAFKAVMDGRQVAILVPTTVLAQQHFETFGQRLSPFPLTVEMLSRFRTKEEQGKILEKLADGEVDIIIGTHRLLQDDVKLKNLGLVIIDEEQRFGVTHKEHFKRIRTQVDVLTLTATPIPRTLYMSLSGVRDISMIQTPPEERLPIITHVGPFDERLVRQAVMRELERGGQVFIVHNRVQTIDAIRERVEQIVPEARVIVGHGQMDNRLLEKVMNSFSQGEYDILISTSIIESGLDIPNANTLIVDRADWFGLAQLYQIRGRVGRSAQQAYAYFFHPSTNRLTDEARARLETLEENTDLGAGFQIAMRDLEIRGAGDILSTRQTGHVAAVGFHLYTQMLTQAIQNLKGTVSSEPVPVVATSTVTIDLPLAAYLPTDYIPEISLRLQIYRRIANLRTADDVDLMREELRDRFGVLPEAVEGLLYQIDVKLLAQRVNATAVMSENDQIAIRLPYLAEIDRNKLQRELGNHVRVSRTSVFVAHEKDQTTWQLRLLDVLTRLSQGVREGVGM